MVDHVIALKGAVTMQTVGKIYRDIEKVSTKSTIVFDFSGIEQVDSSAVALLIAIFRKALERSNSVRWGVIPARIIQFSEIYGLDDEFHAQAALAS